jgi:hypothetical protein
MLVNVTRHCSLIAAIIRNAELPKQFIYIICDGICHGIAFTRNSLEESVRKIYIELTNATDLSPSREAASCTATQQIPSNLSNPMVYVALQWSLSWTKSAQSLPLQSISPRFILILSSHLRLGLPSGLFSSNFPPLTYMHSSSPQFVLHL